jgi:hypothetical protein
MRTLAPSNNHNLLRDRWEIPSVDQVMVEESAGASAKRSVKTSAKLQGLKLAISMMDLTTLEGKDTPGKIASLCRKAMRPLGPQCRWTRRRQDRHGHRSRRFSGGRIWSYERTKHHTD